MSIKKLITIALLALLLVLTVLPLSHAIGGSASGRHFAVCATHPGFVVVSKPQQWWEPFSPAQEAAIQRHVRTTKHRVRLPIHVYYGEPIF